MLEFKETPFGFMFRNSEFFSLDVAAQWDAGYRAMLKKMAAKKTPFHQFVDLRGFRVGPPETQAIIAEGMKTFKTLGGQRSIVLVDSVIVVNQLRRLAQSSGIYAWERYIDIKTYPDYKPVVLAWLLEGKDPDAGTVVAKSA